MMYYSICIVISVGFGAWFECYFVETLVVLSRKERIFSECCCVIISPVVRSSWC